MVSEQNNDTPNSTEFTHYLDEEQLKKLARDLASIAKIGDIFYLHGDLGMGKTTFARSFIKSLMPDLDETDIPSPSFAIVQAYEANRFDISHFDFYRIENAHEVEELGLDEAQDKGVALVEWPEKGEGLLPEYGLRIVLSECDNPDQRKIFLWSFDGWETRLDRFHKTNAFLEGTIWENAHRTFLQGDASARLYSRLQIDTRKSILMDSPRKPDGPPVHAGKSYSQIAHLAEDVLPFVAIGEELRSKGIYTPEILEKDLDEGFLVIEDLGDDVLGKLIADGGDAQSLYQKAVDILIDLYGLTPPNEIKVDETHVYQMPSYDEEALNIETELLLDWYWRAIKQETVSEAEKERFQSLWAEQFLHVKDVVSHWALRDYHSPNLILLSGIEGYDGQMGVIDYQDAQRGHAAYDLVSLLQDARLDISDDIEKVLLDYYCSQCIERYSTDRFNEAEFRQAYAILGAQRNTKILGIFARLAMRDGKPGYLAHIPRIWRYVEKNLEHPSLQNLRAWYDEHFPKNVRNETISISP